MLTPLSSSNSSPPHSALPSNSLLAEPVSGGPMEVGESTRGEVGELREGKGGDRFDEFDDRHSTGVDEEDFRKAFGAFTGTFTTRSATAASGSEGFGTGSLGVIDVTAVATEILKEKTEEGGGPNTYGKFRRILWPLFLGLHVPANHPSASPVPALYSLVDPSSSSPASSSTSSSSTPLSLCALVTASRERYASLYAKHLTAPPTLSALDPQICHPLSNAEANPWKQKEKNEELRAEIFRDVERTFPERTLFQDETVRSTLTRILFVWCRENADVSYKQGMNELLAVVYLVCHRNQLTTGKTTPGAVGSVLLDKQHIEADAFTLFSRLMELGMKSMFASAPSSSTSTQLTALQAAAAGPSNTTTALSPVLSRCNYIYHVLLRNADPSVYNHLISLEVEPQLFLLRWVRLLFCREFHVDDILVIWDAIFADVWLRRSFLLKFSRSADAKQIGRNASAQLPLVDYFAIAMIKFVRTNLLELDYSGCLRRLLKFPPVESVQPLAQVALTSRRAGSKQNYNSAQQQQQQQQRLLQSQQSQEHSETSAKATAGVSLSGLDVKRTDGGEAGKLVDVSIVRSAGSSPVRCGGVPVEVLGRGRGGGVVEAVGGDGGKILTEQQDGNIIPQWMKVWSLKLSDHLGRCVSSLDVTANTRPPLPDDVCASIRAVSADLENARKIMSGPAPFDASLLHSFCSHQPHQHHPPSAGNIRHDVLVGASRGSSLSSSVAPPVTHLTVVPDVTSTTTTSSRGNLIEEEDEQEDIEL
eukprot:GHVS01055447.1.p1 GENE.GHVS01055447.1~~GHVS01055447.1.p1  ORF type:complete len:798 (+),score=163.90 GHVS01055447.1:119-2395(+)